MKDWFLLNVSPSRNKVYHYYFFIIINNYDSEFFKAACLAESAFIIAICCCYRNVHGHFNSLIRKTMRICPLKLEINIRMQFLKTGTSEPNQMVYLLLLLSTNVFRVFFKKKMQKNVQL